MKLYFSDQVCEEQQKLAMLSGVLYVSQPIVVPTYEQEEEEFLQKRKKPKKSKQEKKKKIVAPRELSAEQRKLLAGIIQGSRGSRKHIVQEFFLKNNTTTTTETETKETETKETETTVLPPTKKAVVDAILEMGVREKREKYLSGKSGWFLLEKFREQYDIAAVEKDPEPEPKVSTERKKRKKDTAVPSSIAGNLTKFLSTSETPIIPPPLPRSSASGKSSFVLKKKKKKPNKKTNTPKKRASPSSDVVKSSSARKKRKLPDGWTVESKPRKNSAQVDKTYIAPDGKKYRSLAAAFRSLEPKIDIPPPETKIVYQDENPKKKNSKSAARYDAYKKAKTLKEFYSLGGTKADLRNDLKKGYVKFESNDDDDEKEKTNMDVVVVEEEKKDVAVEDKEKSNGDNNTTTVEKMDVSE